MVPAAALGGPWRRTAACTSSVALVWLWLVEGPKVPTGWDLIGAAASLIGALVIVAAPRP
jgi:drug/metabolite transporter superfamily protein YnfA